MKSLLILPLLLACIWDNDTLRDEQRGLPEVAALIEGRFEKHSDFYYEQRLEVEPTTLDDWDNHAVALEKLGRLDDAIATLEPIVEQHPDRYTAHANLGTFHLHRYLRDKDTADLDRGIALIERAIEINPDAHFGREKYQLMLAKHVRDALAGDEDARAMSFVATIVVDEMSPRKALADWKLNWQSTDEPEGEPPTLGGAYQTELHDVRQYGGRTTPKNLDEIDDAITGVAGMIRFGTGTSPHLYEALGDLLAARGDKQLAARSYLRALEFGHPRADDLRNAVWDTLSMVEDYESDFEGDIDPVTLRFGFEKAEAAAWVAAYQAFEDDLLRRDMPLTDDAYAPFYAEHGNPRDPPAMTLIERKEKFFGDLRVQILIACVVAVLGVTAASLILWKIVRAMRKPSPA